MKHRIIIVILLLLTLAASLMGVKFAVEKAVEKTLAEQTRETTIPTTLPPETTMPTEAPTTEAPTEPTTLPTQAPTETTAPEVRTFTAEEEELLLKIGMAERGDTYCTDCIALVMCTVLNRVESERFSSTIKGVIYAENQFTPVADGTFEKAEPNGACLHALEWIKSGWDESQGALYYEWGVGEGWHSRNLNFLFQHCDTKFYN